ncbi:protein of unknown function [Nitratireductor aquimarinus]
MLILRTNKRPDTAIPGRCVKATAIDRIAIPADQHVSIGGHRPSIAFQNAGLAIVERGDVGLRSVVEGHGRLKHPSPGFIRAAGPAAKQENGDQQKTSHTVHCRPLQHRRTPDGKAPMPSAKAAPPMQPAAWAVHLRSF